MTTRENLKRIEEELRKIESEPLSWDNLDQLLKIFAKAINVFPNIKDFLSWADERNYSQSMIKDYFILGTMKKPFQGKVSPGKVYATLFIDWSNIP